MRLHFWNRATALPSQEPLSTPARANSGHADLILIDILPCILFLVKAVDHRDLATVVDVVFIHWVLYMGLTSATRVAEQTGVQADE